MNAPVIPKLIVPRWIYERTWRFLRADGALGVESGVIWGGRRFGPVGIVMSVLYPTGNDVTRSPHQYRVGPDTASRVGQWLTKHRCRAIAQVHTHPADWVGHSWADDHGPIVSADDFVSIVWPNFARELPSVHALGVHIRVEGSWKRFMDASVEDIVELFDDEAIIDSGRSRQSAAHVEYATHE